VLKLVLTSASLLSILAAAQNATQVSTPPNPSPPLLICSGQNQKDDCAQKGGRIPEPSEAAEGRAAARSSEDLPEAPSQSARGSNEAQGSDDANGTRFVPLALTAEPNSNKSVHTLDRSFILLHSLSAVALIADLETTARSFEGQANATELNPLFGPHPTRARLYGITVPLNALSFYVSYRYKKIEPDRKTWKIAPGLCIAIHTAAAINNLIATHR
jgi:hypothetical protein